MRGSGWLNRESCQAQYPAGLNDCMAAWHELSGPSPQLGCGVHAFEDYLRQHISCGARQPARCSAQKRHQHRHKPALHAFVSLKIYRHHGLSVLLKVFIKHEWTTIPSHDMKTSRVVSFA